MTVQTGQLTSHSRPAASFWLFWVGEGLSAFGSNITILALPLVAALTLHASPFDMGMLIAAGQAPNIAAGVLAGPLIDRSNRRRVLLLTDYASAAFLASVPLLAWAGDLTFPLLAFIAVMLGSSAVIYDVTCMALVPDLIDADRLMWANSCFQATSSVAQVSGPGLAGVLVSVIGATNTLLADVASFLISATTAHLMGRDRHANARQPAAVPASGYWRQIREGATVVARDARLLLLAGGSGAFNLFVGVATAVEILYALHVLKLTPAVLGIAMSLGMLGGVLAAVLASRLVKRFGVPAMLSAGLLFATPAPLVMVSAAATGLAAPWIFGGGLFIDSLGVTLFVICNLGARQMAIAPEMRGRVLAIMRVLNRGTVPLGALAGGIIAAELSLTWALLLSFAGKLLTSAVFAAKRRIIVNIAVPRESQPV
jgi:MFS family permease